MNSTQPLARRRRRRGSALIYCVVALFVMIAISSLSVDIASVRVTRTQLQATADAAVMYGVTGLRVNVDTARSRAIAAAADNQIRGQAVTLTNSDVEFGVWDPTTKNFAVLTTPAAQASATAIRVTARKTIPVTFAGTIGKTNSTPKAVSIASRGKIVAPTINAIACPWLAGMPNGSKVGKQDGNTKDTTAPASTPPPVAGIPITPGRKLSFRQASGQTSWADGSDGTFGPDGDTSWIVQQDAVNGIASTKAPIGAMMGIFLNDNAPNSGSMAATGDFSTSTSRNFTTLSPPLKQVFFIGDGLNSSGQLQEFVIPAGATRFFMGVMDENGWWWDNQGSISSTMLNDVVSLVN